MSADLRRLSQIEVFCSARHHLGIYRAVTTTCRYALPAHLASIRHEPALPLYAALATVVRAHPVLRIGIRGQSTSTPCFAHVPQVDLRSHVEFEHVGCAPERYDEALARVIGVRSDRLFSDVETRPPWKITVVVNTDVSTRDAAAGQEQDGTVDIVFAFHHALMDGTGGNFFHQDLLAALNSSGNPTQTPASHRYVLSFPDLPELPLGQDDAVAFTSSPLFILRTLWEEFGPSKLKPQPLPIWYGHPVSFALPVVTHLRPIFHGPDVLASLLAACRQHVTSVTALLHALTLASLARHTTAAQASCFAGATAISLRPYVRSSASAPDTLRVLYSNLAHEFTAADVTAVRAPQTAAAADTAVWRIAGRVKAELAARAATLPANDKIGLLRFVPDWFELLRKQDGQARRESFSVSNVGVMAGDVVTEGQEEDEEEGERARITHVLFSNPSMVAGAAVGVNVASVAGGSLGIMLSWQGGVVDEALMEHLEADLRCMPRQLHESGTLFL